MDNIHMKLFVIKQSKGRNFIPKMHQNTFGGRAPQWGRTSKGGAREEWGMEKGGEGKSPKVKVSEINTGLA